MYRHSKGVSNSGEKMRVFRKNGSNVWGLALSPLCTDRNTYLLIGHRIHLPT